MVVREEMDIERLVEWAFRVQAVDRHGAVVLARGMGGSSSEALERFARLGVRVDTSGAAPNRAPDDARTIYEAVLALDEIYIEWCARDVAEIWDRAKAEAAGKAIEIVQDDVYLIEKYQIGLGSVQRKRLEKSGASSLVILHGRSGVRPEWYPDWRARRLFPGDPARAEVMHARAIYAAWHLALERLAGGIGRHLSPGLERYDALPPAAPAMPWAGDNGRKHHRSR